MTEKVDLRFRSEKKAALTFYSCRNNDEEDISGNLLGQVIRTTPRRRQKNDVRGSDVGHDVEEVTDDELDPIGDAVHRRVVTREGDLLRVDVDGDHALAGERKLER